MRIMYMSALKELLLAEDKSVLEVVLPNLAAFRAIKKGMEILAKKKVEQKKEIEKVEREGKKTGGTINITQFSATAASITSPQVEHQQSLKAMRQTSKSPARGASPSKIDKA